MKMKNAIVSLFLLFLALVAVAQPVTRFRVTQLFPPTDTVTQYFIQAGSGRDTVKWVPIDSITAGETLDNIYNSDGTINSERSVDLDTYTLTYDVSGGDLDSFVVRFVARDNIVSGWYTGDTPGRLNLVSDKILSTDLTSILNYDGVDDITIANFSDSLVLQGDRVFINPLNLDTDNSVAQVLGRDPTTKELVLTDGTGTGAAWESGYAEAYSNTTDVQSMTTTFTAFDHMVAGDVTADWSWSTVNDEFTYSGATEKYLVVFSFSAHCSTSTFNELTVSVRENGTETTARGQIECGGTGETESTSGIAILTANNTDTFDLGGYWTSGTSNISIKHVELTFTKL